MKHTQRHLQLTALASAVLLSACGGSEDAGSNRGALLDTPVVLTTLTAAQLDASTAASGLQGISGKAICDVKVVSLNYLTPGVKNDTTNASGVMLVPTGTAAACTAPSALVAYAKGTDVQKPRTLANPADGETFLLAAIYAAQGYSVVATDYIGYAKSGYSFHPYLHADSEASSVLDSVRAARSASKFLGYSLSGKTMLTGYSQGGHSSMAAHRAGEADAATASELNIVAGAHLAGPYNLSGSLSSPAVIAGYQFFIPFIITSWQKVYGTVYTDVKTVFKAPYSDYIETLLPSPTLDYGTLLSTGKLPPGPSPTQARDALMQPAFVADVATSKTNGVYLAAVKNDLLGWTPKAKTLLCGGAGDPTVPPSLHQTISKADFDKRGVTTVTSVDVDATIQAVYGTAGKAPTDPTSAAFATYYGNYHGAYEPPFCHQRAKLMFDTVK